MPWKRILYSPLHECIWVRGSIAPRILNLGTRWKWVVRFTPRPLYPRRERPLSTHWIAGWVDLRPLSISIYIFFHLLFTSSLISSFLANVADFYKSYKLYFRFADILFFLNSNFTSMQDRGNLSLYKMSSFSHFFVYLKTPFIATLICWYRCILLLQNSQ
jgi:hypothetical protein